MKFDVTNTWQQLPYTTGTLYIPRGIVYLSVNGSTPSSTEMGIAVTENVRSFHTDELNSVWIRIQDPRLTKIEVQVENFI